MARPPCNHSSPIRHVRPAFHCRYHTCPLLRERSLCREDRIRKQVWYKAVWILQPEVHYMATRYVPHANRALRSFNVYLNVRSPPLRSSLNPFSYFFPRTPLTTSSQQLPNAAPRASSPRRAPAIPPIPPTSNPRGELIFSSRVDPSFRESYERYRGAFERKREEQKRATRGSWFDFLPWRKAKQPQPQIQLQTPHGGGASLRGRTPSTTPSSSRRSSPAPGAASKGSLRRLKAGRSGTPVLEAPLIKEKESHGTESFSFLLAGQEASSDP
jgi:Spo7-like protein